MPKTKKTDAKTILYDASCPVCRIVINKVDGSVEHECFQAQDIKAGDLPAGVQAEKAEREIHVIDSQGNILSGADAVLDIVSEYPRWAWLARLGRLPGIIHILRLVYRIVAANRHFIVGPNAWIFWTKVTLCLGMLTGLALTLPLWTGERAYPFVPASDALPVLSPLVGSMLVGAMCALLAGALVASRPRSYIWGFLVLAVVMVMLDQSRLQPWFFQYCLLLAALGLFSWRHTDETPQRMVLASCMLAVAFIYIYSGLQKLNLNFISSVFPWLIQPVAGSLPDTLGKLVSGSGFLVALLELAIGIGLLVTRTRKAAVILALMMHLSILYCLGPWGHDWNNAVWPWNLVMMALVPLIFWRSGLPARRIFWNPGFPYHWLLVLLFAVLPMLSLFGRWDSYLSSSLYSGTVKTATIEMDAVAADFLPERMRGYTSIVAGTTVLSVTDWSFGEMNVPPYPESRIFQALARDVCRQTGDSPSVHLKVRDPLTGQTRFYGCVDL